MASWTDPSAADGHPALTELDWSIFDDPVRGAFVASIDEAVAQASASLERITRLAAVVAGTECAQISLIGSSQFVPAAHGCGYPAEQQHTPIRDSLCSVTMVSGGTLAVADTRSHPWVAHLPPVQSGAVGCYLGVPVWDPDGRPIGALCAFDADSRLWTGPDRTAMEDLAALLTRELHLLAELHHAAGNQTRLREVIVELVDRVRSVEGAGLRAAAGYRAAAEDPAGGDWTDWTVLDADRVAFSIGDVAGHGLEAVMVMEELRHTLRAYAVQGADPSETLLRANRMLSTVRPGTMATALTGEFNIQTDTVILASAGHPPPVLWRSGRADTVALTPSPPLGYCTAPPALQSLPLKPGDRLVLATDGLFERRGEPLTDGLARLVAAVQDHAGARNLDHVVDQLLATMLPTGAVDDACVLVIERPPPPPSRPQTQPEFSSGR